MNVGEIIDKIDLRLDLKDHVREIYDVKPNDPSLAALWDSVDGGVSFKHETESFSNVSDSWICNFSMNCFGRIWENLFPDIEEFANKEDWNSNWRLWVEAARQGKVAFGDGIIKLYPYPDRPKVWIRISRLISLLNSFYNTGTFGFGHGVSPSMSYENILSNILEKSVTLKLSRTPEEFLFAAHYEGVSSCHNLIKNQRDSGYEYHLGQLTYIQMKDVMVNAYLTDGGKYNDTGIELDKRLARCNLFSLYDSEGKNIWAITRVYSMNGFGPSLVNALKKQAEKLGVNFVYINECGGIYGVTRTVDTIQPIEFCNDANIKLLKLCPSKNYKGWFFAFDGGNDIVKSTTVWDIPRPTYLNAETVCYGFDIVEDDERFQCCRCGEYVDEDNMFTGGGDDYCEGCYRDSFTRCYNCDEDVENEDTAEFDGNWYCNYCYSKLFWECDMCGEFIKRNTPHHFVGNKEICSDCRGEYTSDCISCKSTELKEDLYDGLCDKCNEEKNSQGSSSRFENNARAVIRAAQN